MADSLIEYMAQRVREGKLNLDDLVSYAPHVWWAWDVVEAVAPDRLSFARPKRPRGRWENENFIRDVDIFHEVEFRRKLGCSLREACKITAGFQKPKMTTDAVIKAHAKERKRQSVETNT